MKTKLYFFLFLFSLFILSCNKKSEPEVFDYDYYPLSTGNYYIYSVSTTVIGPTGTAKDSFQLKEVIADTFHFNDVVKYRIERFLRKKESDQWPSQPDSVWTVYSDKIKAVRTENNYSFIKMVWPMKENTQWNGNGLNILKAQTYTAKNIHKPYFFDDQNFPQTITVVQSDEESKIDKDYEIEVYAKNIGLVYKISEVYEYDEKFLGTNQVVIKSGKKYLQKLITYGKN